MATQPTPPVEKVSQSYITDNSVTIERQKEIDEFLKTTAASSTNPLSGATPLWHAPGSSGKLYLLSSLHNHVQIELNDNYTPPDFLVLSDGATRATHIHTWKFQGNTVPNVNPQKEGRYVQTVMSQYYYKDANGVEHKSGPEKKSVFIFDVGIAGELQHVPPVYLFPSGRSVCRPKCIDDVPASVPVNSGPDKITVYKWSVTPELPYIDPIGTVDPASPKIDTAPFVLAAEVIGKPIVGLNPVMPVPPSIGSVTEVLVGGSGAFDVFMRAGKAQLDEEFKKGRIKGADYTNAIIGLIEIMMTKAEEFVVSKYETDEKFSRLSIEIQRIAYEAQLASQTLSETIANGALDRTMKKAQVEEMLSKIALLETEKEEMRLAGPIDRTLKKEQMKEINVKVNSGKQQMAEVKANGPLDRNIKKAQAVQAELSGKLAQEQVKDTVAKTALTAIQTSELKQNGIAERTQKKAMTQTQIQQAAMYERQARAFDDKKQGDAFGEVLSAWKVGAVEEPDAAWSPGQIKGPAIDNLIIKMLSQTGLKLK